MYEFTYLHSRYENSLVNYMLTYLAICKNTVHAATITHACECSSHEPISEKKKSWDPQDIKFFQKQYSTFLTALDAL